MGLSLHIVALGSRFIEICNNTGGSFILLAKVIKRLIALDMEREEFKRSTLLMGFNSLAVIIPTAVVVGVILVIQAFVFVDRYGMRSQLGWGAGFVIIRELGPVLFALMFSGRVGAYTAAELGTMTVTDQVDGLKCLAIDPISFLVAPRFVAMIISLSTLTIIGNTFALVSASVVGQALMNVDQHTFWSNLFIMLTPWDYFTGILKSIFFGAIIAIISCHYGLNTTGGAPGVGKSVNSAVVSSAIAIFIVDFFSTFIIG